MRATFSIHSLLKRFESRCRVWALCLFCIVIGSGMTVSAHEDAEHADAAQETEKALPPPPPIIVRATGYASYSSPKDKVDQADPKRLLAIRASKLDAYRNLAERVYGIALQGRSAVKTFELQEDYFATAIDTVIRGARVVSIAENKTTGIETVLELLLPGDFQDCLNKLNNFRYGEDCLRPLTPTISRDNETAAQGALKPPRGMDTIYYLN